MQHQPQPPDDALHEGHWRLTSALLLIGLVTLGRTFATCSLLKAVGLDWPSLAAIITGTVALSNLGQGHLQGQGRGRTAVCLLFLCASLCCTHAEAVKSDPPFASVGIRVDASHHSLQGTDCGHIFEHTSRSRNAIKLPDLSVGFYADRLHRPLPTPLRSRNATKLPVVADDGVQIGHGDLETLLEESVRTGQGKAMFLAATLIEALIEHAADSLNCHNATVSDSVTEKGQTLHLADHLPSVRVFDLDRIQFNVGCTLDHVVALIQGPPLHLAPLPDSNQIFCRQWNCAYPYCSEPILPALKSIAIYTDGSFDGTKSSWAFHALGDNGNEQFSLGWIGDLTVLDPSCSAFLGASAHGALQGELSALFWCAVWLFPFPTDVAVEIYSDCTTAISLSAGTAGQYRGPDLASSCREILQALEARRGQAKVRLHHIRSHVGHAGNEVADLLAKCCCRGHWPQLSWEQRPIGVFLREGRLTWLWLLIEIHRSPHAWPVHAGSSLTDSTVATAPPPSKQECENMLGLQDPPEGLPSPNFEKARLQAIVLTVNVQSLQADDKQPTQTKEDKGFTGRAGLLRAQLDQLGVCIAALQETRAARSETIQSQTHIRFCSARDGQGSYGTELWFSRSTPFIWHNVAPIVFQVSDFLVVHWTPRIIAVRFSRGSLRILFVAVHAPTNQSPARDVWWKDLRVLLDRLRQGSQIVLVGDFSLHLHKLHGDRTGELTWATKYPPPDVFWEILDAYDLWVPCTFACCHTGPTATWHAPGGTSTSRLDYIAIPSGWQVPSAGSYVVPELDWGQSNPDHFALRTCVVADMRFGYPKCGRQPRLDTQAMRTPEGRTKIQEICALLPEQPWELDVHRHAAGLESHFRKYLPVAFPPPRARQTKTYLQADTWQVRNQRAWLRKRVHNGAHQGQVFTIRASFLAWKFRAPCRHIFCRLFARLLRSCKELPAHLAALRETSSQVRGLVRRDVKTHLHDTAVKAVSDPTKDTVQRLRELTGGPRRKQRNAAPLPSVETRPGHLAETHEEAKHQWIRHFSKIEDGHICDVQAFIQGCYDRQASKDLSGYAVEVADVTGLSELEGAMRDACTERAYGLAGIPGEIVRFGAPQLSKAVYALFLKSIFRLAEPVQHKGGTLYCIWKGKGPKQTCDSYRGILVSSVVGKTLHKLVRRRCTPALTSVAAPLQVGGLPRFPVTIPAQAARLFQAACSSKQQSHALVFLDLQEAFYRIIRPLISGGPLSDELVAHVCSAVHLPPGTMHDLRSHLGGEPLISSAGSSAWASGAVEESLCDTWFRLPNEPELVCTQTGSRPGDSLSDLVFSFLFSRVLRQVRNSLGEHGILARVPYDPAMDANICPLPAPPANTIAISDATWMDDLSMFIVGASASSLTTDLVKGTSALIDACLQRALVPNLSRGKTEAMVQFHGKGTRKARQYIFGDCNGAVPLECQQWPLARLRIVPTYKHLGGYLQHGGGLRQEISFRIAQARDAFNRRKKKVFKSPLVSISDKANLFQSLISTVLFHGAGTWTDIGENHLTTLDGAMRQMACQMLAPSVSLSDAWKIGLSQVLARVGLPCALTQLHVARLRHLLACIQLRIPEIWALAHWEESWLESVRASVRWMWELSDAGRSYADWQTAWQSWRIECIQHPGKWTARIRRVLAVALRQEQWRACVEQHAGLLVRQVRIQGATMPLELTGERSALEVCAVCQSVFKDFQSWSVHAFKRHGRTREARSLVDGRQCPGCLRHYASNLRLCRHLHHSTSCRHFLAANGEHPCTTGFWTFSGRWRHRIR